MNIYNQIFGSNYKLKKLGKFSAIHPKTIQRIVSKIKDEEVLDMVAMLCYHFVILENRAEYFAKQLTEIHNQSKKGI